MSPLRKQGSMAKKRDSCFRRNDKSCGGGGGFVVDLGCGGKGRVFMDAGRSIGANNERQVEST